MNRRNPHPAAFTLIELLLVVTIIVILVSLLMVGYRNVNTLLKEKSCQNNLSKIGAILDQYCQRNKGFYPDIYGAFPCIQRWKNYGVGIPPAGPPQTVWTAMANVRMLNDMGATDALFTCPFSVANPTPNTIGTFSAPHDWGAYYQFDFTSYMPFFFRGNNVNHIQWNGGNPEAPGQLLPFKDGRLSPISNTCKGNTPIMADLLYMRPGFAAGWFHGGGFVPNSGAEPILYFPGGQPGQQLDVADSQSLGYNNSGCNTLFAGGYVVHSEPGDFQDAQGNLDPTKCGMPIDIWGSTNACYWFALQPTNN